MSKTTKTVAPCRYKLCTRPDCWFSHTPEQKPDKKTAPVVTSNPEQKKVKQPVPVVAEIPEQSPELHAGICSDDDDNLGVEVDDIIIFIGSLVFLCQHEKKLAKILEFIIFHLFNTYGVNYDNDEDFYDDHTDLSYYREKIVFILSDERIPLHDLLFIQETVREEILGSL